jgi:PKD repeat protein
VSFHARVTGAEPGERLTIRWTFGDGTSDTGDSVRHTYDATGSYDALATVTGSRDSGGTSDLVTVHVGDAKKKGPRKGAPKGQPVPTAPGSGPSEGDPGARPGGTETGGSNTGGTGGTSPDTADPTASADGPDTATPQPTGERDAKPEQSQPQTPAGKVVSGLVLASNGVPLSEAKNPTPPLARSAARLGDAHPVALPLGSLALLSLMGLGAWREAVSVRRRGS